MTPFKYLSLKFMMNKQPILSQCVTTILLTCQVKKLYKDINFAVILNKYIETKITAQILQAI